MDNKLVNPTNLHMSTSVHIDSLQDFIPLFLYFFVTTNIHTLLILKIVQDFSNTKNVCAYILTKRNFDLFSVIDFQSFFTACWNM